MIVVVIASLSCDLSVIVGDKWMWRTMTEMPSSAAGPLYHSSLSDARLNTSSNVIGNEGFTSSCSISCACVRSFHSIHNVVDGGVLQAMWGELVGQVVHSDQLIICWPRLYLTTLCMCCWFTNSACINTVNLQCFDVVDCMTGRTSCVHLQSPVVVLDWFLSLKW